jgi:hypothetical protein
MNYNQYIIAHVYKYSTEPFTENEFNNLDDNIKNHLVHLNDKINNYINNNKFNQIIIYIKKIIDTIESVRLYTSRINNEMISLNYIYINECLNS